MVFEDLEAQVSANTFSFVRRIENAEHALNDFSDEAIQTAAAFQVLQGRADEAGDEIGSVGRNAGIAATSLGGLALVARGTRNSFGSLIGATSILNVSFSSLASTSLLAVIPALTAASTALLSTLVPLAAVVGTLTLGVGALAAAFTAVIGTGILAFGEKRGEQNKERLQEINAQIQRLEALQETEEGLTQTQQERLEQLEEQQKTLEEQTGILGGLQSAMSDLGDELAPIITAFGEEFIPLIEDAIDGLPELVENIFSAIGGLDEFAAIIRDMGEAAADVLPFIASSIITLAEHALPPFLEFIEFIGRNAGDALWGMLRITRELAPEFRALGRALFNALPEIARLGTFILNRAIPALTSFFQVVEDVIQIGQDSSGFVGFLRSLVSRAVTWIQGPGWKMLQKIGTQVIDGLATFLSPSSNEDASILTALTNRIASLLDGVVNWLNTGGKQKIEQVLTTLFGQLANTLNSNRSTFVNEIVAPVVEIIAGVFDALVAALQSDEANQLSLALANLAEETMEYLGDAMVAYAQSDAFKEDLKGLGGAIGNTAGAAVSEFFQSDKLQDGPDTISEFRNMSNEATVQQSQTTTQNQQTNASSTDVNVEITGDTEVVEDTAVTVFDRELQRQADTYRANTN